MTDQKECRCHCINPEAAAALLLRLSIGVLFFFAGLGKFLGEGGASASAKGIVGQFSETFLPGFLVAPYAYALPYIEVILGAMLIVGLCSRASLFLSGLLLISLAFGMQIQHQYAVAASSFNYVLIAAVGLWFASKDNRYSLDRFCRKNKE